MSSVERILLSENCCSFGLIGESAELWISLFVGLCISGIIVLCYNAWTSRGHIHTEIKSGLCTSPDCIRCSPDRDSTNRMISENFNKYMDSTPRIRAPRVCQAVSDHLTKDTSCLFEKSTSIIEQNPTLFLFPNLTAKPWWDFKTEVPLSFAKDLQRLKDNVQKLESEFRILDELFRKNPKSSGWLVNDLDHWRVYHLINQGSFVFDNCARCPDTLSVISQLKNLMFDCIFGYVSFSVLEPSSTISTHCGSTNVRLRCHLGIDIPYGCKISVAGDSREWQAQSCILFDDSYPHSVSHQGKTFRVVFMVDFWHPEINGHERVALQEIFPPQTRGLKQNNLFK